MGLEIVVLLVDVPSLRQLVSTLWSDLYSGLEKTNNAVHSARSRFSPES